VVEGASSSEEEGQGQEMKSVLLYTASGDYIAVRRPIGFNRPLEVSQATPEEWSENAPDHATGTLVGYYASYWSYDGKRAKR